LVPQSRATRVAGTLCGMAPAYVARGSRGGPGSALGDRLVRRLLSLGERLLDRQRAGEHLLEVGSHRVRAGVRVRAERCCGGLPLGGGDELRGVYALV